MSTPLIQISHVDFAYGQQLVLKHIDLEVPAGSSLGLIGPNGGGKTTLLRLLLNLLSPTRGSVSIDGLSPRQAIAAGDRIGWLPQNPAISRNFPLSVRQVVRLGLAGRAGLLRAYPRSSLAFVESLLDRMGLRDLAAAPIGELSSGQQQRALIARALAARPKLLLLDEPTTGIDATGQQRFVDLVASLRQEMELTLIFTSHDLRAVTSLCDRIACLNVTLHYHDVPERLPPQLAYSMFACDLEAMGINCDNPSHHHPHPGHPQP